MSTTQIRKNGNEEILFFVHLFDDPFIVTSQIILKCCFKNDAYAPTAIITMEELTEELLHKRQGKGRKVKVSCVSFRLTIF